MVVRPGKMTHTDLSLFVGYRWWVMGKLICQDDPCRQYSNSQMKVRQWSL